MTQNNRIAHIQKYANERGFALAIPQKDPIIGGMATGRPDLMTAHQKSSHTDLIEQSKQSTSSHSLMCSGWI